MSGAWPQLNRSALTGELSGARQKKMLEAHRVAMQKVIQYCSVVASFVVLAPLVIGWLVGLTQTEFDYWTTVLIAFFGLTLVAIPLIITIYLGYRPRDEQKLRRARLEQFAADNGLAYQELNIHPSLKGTFFRTDKTRYKQTYDVLYDPLDHGFEIGNFRYLGLMNSKSDISYEYSYARVRLSKRLPHVLLDSKANTTYMSNLPEHPHGLAPLEADIGDHFRLYGKKGSDVLARYVFTSDIMAMILDYGRMYDIEIIDDQLLLYLSRPLDIFREGEIERVLMMLDALSDKLDYQTRRYTST